MSIHPFTNTIGSVNSAPVKQYSPPLQRAASEARMIVQAARQERQLIIDQAVAESEGIRKSAHNEGFSQGMYAAKRSILATIEREKEKLFNSKDLIIEAAIKIAEDITLAAINIDKESLLRRLARALELLNSNDLAAVIVPTEDFPVVAKQFQQYIPDAKIKLESNSNLASGSAQIRTRNGIIDIDPLMHLQRYKATLIK